MMVALLNWRIDTAGVGTLAIWVQTRHFLVTYFTDCLFSHILSSFTYPFSLTVERRDSF